MDDNTLSNLATKDDLNELSDRFIEGLSKDLFKRIMVGVVSMVITIIVLEIVLRSL